MMVGVPVKAPSEKGWGLMLRGVREGADRKGPRRKVLDLQRWTVTGPGAVMGEDMPATRGMEVLTIP